jgi:hypothetical protein
MGILVADTRHVRVDTRGPFLTPIGAKGDCASGAAALRSFNVGGPMGLRVVKICQCPLDAGEKR